MVKFGALEKTLKKIFGILLAVAVLAGAGIFLSPDRPLPFGLFEEHLNVVYSVSDAEATEQFYGEILGLQRLPDIDFPGEAYMIRYLGGESEIKFIVGGQDLPSMEGGTRNARGIRLLALLLPENQRAGIVARMLAAGLQEPEFTDGSLGPVDFSYGMTRDYDDNQVEIVFLSDMLPDFAFSQLQIGLAVSDKAAMAEFLQQVLEFEPVETEKAIYRFELGKTQIKFWQLPATSPAWVGSPNNILGMSLVQFLVADVESVRSTILARGGKIHTEPFLLGDIATIMFVEGPDGILFEFAAPLAE
jgi:catechol 2,3-dioxygenase-like lactoylglutathione lyase family enzyme